MRLLIDMNLSPAWVSLFSNVGIEATHWSTVGRADAPDTEIMAWASQHECIVFTHDLDFGTILRLTAALKPSVVQIRAEDVRPASMGDSVCAAIRQTMADLQRGALLTIDPRKSRISLLPLQHGG
jgi:predicted nuclease of predicted toxin-antitoxin system